MCHLLYRSTRQYNTINSLMKAQDMKTMAFMLDREHSHRPDVFHRMKIGLFFFTEIWPKTSIFRSKDSKEITGAPLVGKTPLLKNLWYMSN